MEGLLLVMPILRPGVSLLPSSFSDFRVGKDETMSKQKYQIPMEVTDETIRDYGLTQKDIVTTKIGNRTVRAFYVDVDEAVYYAYMRPEWKEDKRRQREQRGMTVNRFGNLVTCNKDCQTCEDQGHCQRRVISYEGLVEDGYDPESSNAGVEELVERRERIAEVGRCVAELNPEEQAIAAVLARGLTDRKAAERLGMAQSSYSYKKKKLKSKLENRLKDFI